MTVFYNLLDGLLHTTYYLKLDGFIKKWDEMECFEYNMIKRLPF